MSVHELRRREIARLQTIRSTLFDDRGYLVKGGASRLQRVDAFIRRMGGEPCESGKSQRKQRYLL